MSFNDYHNLIQYKLTFFSLNANTYKWAFWTIAHLLYDSDLMKSIRLEILATMSNGKLNTKALLDECPRFNSLLDEILRLYSNSSSVRFILEDTIIGGKTFRKGNRIMMPYRQLHENDQVYGDDVSKFVPDRFIKDKTLRRSPCFRPFGGGSTWCPGRFVARKEVIAFVASILYQFEISLVKTPDGLNQVFPRVESAKPSFGMMGVVSGDDLKVKVCLR